MAEAGTPGILIDELEAAARLKFVHWDPVQWRRFLTGPAAELAASMGAEPPGDSTGPGVFPAYLRLACEAIGLGYLFPAESGAQSVFSLLWNSLLPRLLPGLPVERRPEAVAACWNLGENLELSPLWVRRVFYRSLGDLHRLETLEDLVQRVSREAFEPPDVELREVGKLAWVDLAAEDRRILPGAVHYLAPRVACVHDRERVGGPGIEAVTCGVWLAPTPVPLGPMGCRESIEASNCVLDPTLASTAQRLDPRADLPFAGARNAYSAVFSLVSSQQVVALLP